MGGDTLINLRELCGEIIQLSVHVSNDVTVIVTGRVRLIRNSLTRRTFIAVGELGSNGASLPTATAVRKTGRNGQTYVKD